MIYISDTNNFVFRRGDVVGATQMPTITSALTANGPVGVPFNYQITATNSPTSYTALGLPAGLAINGSSGLISGTPTTIGSIDVLIRAITAGGDAGSDSAHRSGAALGTAAGCCCGTPVVGRVGLTTSAWGAIGPEHRTARRRGAEYFAT